MLKRLSAVAYTTDVIRLLYAYTINKMIIRYIKKFLTFFGLGLLDDDDDKKLRVKLLLPGLESGWYNTNAGSFVYKTRGEGNNNNS